MGRVVRIGSVILAGLIIGFFSLALYPVSEAAAPLISPVPSPGTAGIHQYPRPGIPVRLMIPKIAVNVMVEQVGRDSDGRMAVPQQWTDTGWYAEGVRPGEAGNAVIDGHVNTPTLEDSVFAKLDTLQPGNAIVVADENGRMWNFTVTAVTDVKTAEFPLERVFGDSPERRLNLITCSGTYDHSLKDYTGRIVVYAKLDGTYR